MPNNSGEIFLTGAAAGQNGSAKGEKPLGIKAYAIIAASVFAFFIFSAIVGNILESKGILTVEKLGAQGVTAVKIFYFGLFCILGLSIVPLAIRYFISAQTKIGNAEIFLVKFIQGNERAVVICIWVLFFIGLCMAVPAAIKGGFFK